MKFKFWGVRGSIPAPGAQTVKYGGNTTCIEIRTAANDLIILDGGTGIHALAQRLPKGKPVNAHIFITHFHWDHIQGLPFFLPIFSAQNTIHFYGGLDPITHQGVERALKVQLQHSFFPICEAELNATVAYHTIKARETVAIGDAKITAVDLNHPVLNFGYRIECDGKSLFFTGDYEPLLNDYPPNTKQYAEYQQIIDNKQEEINRMANADVLIVDSSYTETEYQSKKGWGHGTHQSALALARSAGAKKLFFTHHEPNRADGDLEAIFTALTESHNDLTPELHLAQEGVEYIPV